MDDFIRTMFGEFNLDHAKEIYYKSLASFGVREEYFSVATYFIVTIIFLIIIGYIAHPPEEKSTRDNKRNLD